MAILDPGPLNKFTGLAISTKSVSYTNHGRKVGSFYSLVPGDSYGFVVCPLIQALRLVDESVGD